MPSWTRPPGCSRAAATTRSGSARRPELVGLSTSTLYHYYATKQDILYAVIGRFLREFADALVAGLRDTSAPPRARLERAVTDHVVLTVTRREELAGNPVLNALTAEQQAGIAALRRSYRDAVRDVIAEGAAAGQFDVADPLLTAMAMLDMLDGIRAWYHEDGACPSTSSRPATGRSRCPCARQVRHDGRRGRLLRGGASAPVLLRAGRSAAATTPGSVIPAPIRTPGAGRGRWRPGAADGSTGELSGEGSPRRTRRTSSSEALLAGGALGIDVIGDNPDDVRAGSPTIRCGVRRGHHGRFAVPGAGLHRAAGGHPAR